MIVVRKADEGDLPAIRRMLPDVFEHRRGRQRYFVAERSGDVVGAAALATGRYWYADLRSLEPDSSLQVERLLLERLTEAARSLRVPKLRAWRAVAQAGPGAERWTALGFEPLMGFILYESALQSTLEMHERRIEKARSAGKIPPSAKVVPVSEAPLAEVVRLRCRLIGGRPAPIRRRLLGKAAAENYSPDLSLALLLDGKTVAIRLGWWEDDKVAYLDSSAAVPEARGGWGSLLLGRAWVKRAIAAGATLYRYKIELRNENVHHIARATGAREIRHNVLYAYDSTGSGLSEESGPADDDPHMDRDFITIVSGLPRSGTSLMMQMLEAGGVPVLTDGLRAADRDNPRGYYEFELVKTLGRAPSQWLGDAAGRAVKIIHLLLNHLPTDNAYRVIFMERDLGEVLRSQAAMLERGGKAGAALSPERLSALFAKQIEAAINRLSDQPNIELLRVNHRDVIEQPGVSAESVSRFLDSDLDVEAMAAAVDPALHRQKTPNRS